MKKEIEVKVRRTDWIESAILGRMTVTVDGEVVFGCHTLEPQERAKFGAITEGTYEGAMVLSPKFKSKRLKLLNVPNRGGILIHEGNTHLDTDGCILVGMTRTITTIGVGYWGPKGYDIGSISRSKEALNCLMGIIGENDKITIKIE